MASDDDKKNEKSSGEAPKETGGGSKLGTILTILNLVITLGIGAVVFIQFKKDKNKEQVTDIQATGAAGEHGAAPAEHGGGEHGDKKEEGHGAAPAEHGDKKEEGHGGGQGGAAAAKSNGVKIVTLEQFTVNLSTMVGTPPRFARVVIAVEVPSEDTSQELNQKMPQVRNAIIDLFNSKRPSDLQNGEGRNFLREEIRNALNSFLISGKVKGVFFSNFAVSS